MAKIRQSSTVQNKEHRLTNKKKFRRKLQLFKVFRVIEFLLIVAIAAKVYIK